MTKTENNILLFSITLCWAASYIFIKNLPENLSSYAYLTLTTGIAAILMILIFFRRLKELRKSTWAKGFLICLYWRFSQKRLPISSSCTRRNIRMRST